MAIQFRCPYCTAVIRVPDAAAGKSGECPKCGSRLLVPTIEIPPAAASARSPASSADPATPERDSSSRIVPPHDPPLPVFEPDPPASIVERASIATAVKRKRRRRSGLLFPILCGGVFVLVIGWFYWEAQVKFEGELPAVALPDAELEPKLLDRGYFAPLPNETVDLVLDGLAKQSPRFQGEFAVTELRGDKRGILISVGPASATQFYRVNVGADRELLAFVRDTGRELNEPRDVELQAAAVAFAREWEAAELQDRAVADPAKYRDSLALNALVGGFGYNIEAVCLGRVYPCVYEDQGGLYFLLPKDIREFELRGRKLPSGSVLLPARYTVRVADTTQ